MACKRCGRPAPTEGAFFCLACDQDYERECAETTAEYEAHLDREAEIAADLAEERAIERFYGLD